MSKHVAFVSVAILFVTWAAWAQTDGSTTAQEFDRLGTVPTGAMTPLGTNGFGVENYAAAVTDPHAFQPYDVSLGHKSWFDGYISSQTGDTFRGFEAPVDLPTGALLDSVNAMVYDDDAAGYVIVRLYYWECVGGSPCTKTDLVDEETGDVDTPGYTVLTSSAGVNGMTWKNFDESVNSVNCGTFQVGFSVASNNLRVGPVWIWYQRQISPAPGVATFPDVGTGFWAFQAIEALASSGVTTGFPDGTFRPLEPVTRAQMATFLARALGLDFHDLSY